MRLFATAITLQGTASAQHVLSNQLMANIHQLFKENMNQIKRTHDIGNDSEAHEKSNILVGSTENETAQKKNTSQEGEDKVTLFHEMGLNNCLLKAIAQLNWKKPTLIQEKAIPLAIEGKDILSRARTGSGKTGAYAIPVIQALLEKKEKQACVRALVLVPSRELSSQVHNMFGQLLSCSPPYVTCSDLSRTDAELTVLNAKPDIVIGTPSRILMHVKSGNLDISSSLEWLIIDEADLVLSFGYEDDLKKLVSYFPNTYQSFVTSATFTDDINALKNLVLKNPVTLQLKESALPSNDRLTQYHVICETEEDKFLLLCALLKLRLVQGKCLIFVNSITRCYRVKLFLEQFSLFCCVLNSELPVNCRCHTVEQFNKGLYDYIIATDETHILDAEEASVSTSKTKKRKRSVKTKEFGVSRGVDFQKVSNVINFDFPESVAAYIHRVGRTARGDSAGTALSFVTGEEIQLLKEAQSELGDDNCLRPYQFAMKEIEGLRYRCNDAIRIVTKQAIKDARLRELRAEMLNSTKLQSYFEENPKDLQVLRHNDPLNPSKVKQHMKHIPEYLSMSKFILKISVKTFC